VVNRKMRRLVGPGRVLGRRLAEAAPQMATPEFMAVLETVFEKGQRVVQRRLSILPSPSADELSGPRFFDLVCQATRDLDGDITGIFVMGADVTEHVDALDRQALLSNELNHRVKNTLAVILSVARLSAKSAADLDQFTQGFTERVEAMANTHDLLTEVGWTVVEVQDIIGLELAPYAGAAARIRLDCDPVSVAAAEAVNTLVNSSVPPTPTPAPMTPAPPTTSPLRKKERRLVVCFDCCVLCSMIFSFCACCALCSMIF